MILAAIDWLSISINLLLVAFVIVCLLMTLLILMQRPKQEGLGAAFGAGVTDQVFGARTTNVLQRGTVYLGSAFFLFSFILAILIGLKNKQTTLLTDEKSPAAAKVEEAPPAEPAPEKSLSEELPETPPVTPVTPEVEAPVIPEEEQVEQPAPEEIPADAPEVEATPEEAAPATEDAPEEESPAPADSEEKPAGQ